jgi:hypothetical protein
MRTSGNPLFKFTATAVAGSMLIGTVIANAAAFAQASDPRITVADVEKVAGIKGVQMMAPGSTPGAGAGLNFAGPDKKMILMVNFGTAELYNRAKAQKEMSVGGMKVPMPLFHASVPGIGDEAFDSPPGNMQYVLYLRKGQRAASLTTYISNGKPLLTMAQLKQLGIIVASRL